MQRFKNLVSFKLNKLSLVKQFSAQKASAQDDYQQVPHYMKKSSLYIKPMTKATHDNEQPFHKVVSPYIKIDELFDAITNFHKSQLSINLSARHINLDLTRFKEDYFKMKELEKEIADLNDENKNLTDKIRHLVRVGSEKGVPKEIVMKSDEMNNLLKAGNEIKSKINIILEELVPLEELITIAYLRLPNDLHASGLFIHMSQLNRNFNLEGINQIKESAFDNLNELALFNFNTEYLNEIELKRDQIKLNSNDWHRIINNKSNFGGKWSFIEKLDNDLIHNNRYLVGAYAKIERSVIDYIYHKFNTLNIHTEKSYEHIKSVSMLKSSIVEGCGKTFNDFNYIFNIVRFGGHQSTQGQLANDDKNQMHHIELHHLMGSSSLSSLVLNFARTQVNPKYLPWHLYTMGRNYSPKHGQRNTFDLLSLCAESSSYMMANHEYDDAKMKTFLSSGELYLKDLRQQVEEFSRNYEKNQINLNDLIPSGTKTIDTLFIDLLKLFIFVFKDFKIPMRFVCLETDEFRSNESFRIEAQAYLPSERSYVTIGKVCLLNDYVSRRLQIRIKNEKEDAKNIKHVAMIHTRLVDITAFIQVLIETNLVNNSRSKLEYNHQDENLNRIENLSFELPQVLNKFYLH